MQSNGGKLTLHFDSNRGIDLKCEATQFGKLMSVFFFLSLLRVIAKMYINASKKRIQQAEYSVHLIL